MGVNGKIYLHKEMFSGNEKVLFNNESFTVSIFRYSTMVEAVTIKNNKGYITVLPFLGQMIWDMEFLNHKLVMKSIYDEPEYSCSDYSQCYGCFLMHCGLTAIGNPKENDNHIPHGELPISRYQNAYIVIGEDDKGKYIGIGGVYTHKKAYAYNYDFSPEIRLYEDKSTIDVTVNIKNNKDIPLEYFYLCHINYLPVDGAKLLYTAKHENITLHKESLDDYIEPWASATREYMKRLDENIAIMDTVDKMSQSYAPGIVFTCKYDSDKDGKAHTMQLLPDGYSCYVCHSPEELPYGIRWISRTEDEEAMGMVLPATAEHKGLTQSRLSGQQRYLKTGETVSYHITTGILSPGESDEMVTYIKGQKA